MRVNCKGKSVSNNCKRWTTSFLLINMFSQGLVLAYPFSLLLAINHPKSPMKSNLHTSSWLGSIIGVAYIPGFMISLVLMTFYGRRLVYALGILPSIAGWLMIYSAKDITTLMIGRFLNGLTAGAIIPLEAMMIGEYTAPKYKGRFLYLKNAAVCMGVTLMHIISRCLHWRTIALVALAPLIVALLIVYTWPESSARLAPRCEYEGTEQGFYCNRGHSKSSKKELDQVIKSQTAKLSTTKLKLSYLFEVMDFCQKMKQKDFLKPVMIVVLATLVLEVSCKHVFPSYAFHILAGITGDTTQSFYNSVGIDLAITASALFAAVLGKIMNQRTLLFSTGFSALFVLMSLCIYLFLTSKDMIHVDKPWISVGLLGVYFMLVTFGWASILLTLIGAIFPLAHKGLGSVLSEVWISIWQTVVLKATPHLLVNVGVHGCFAVYGSIMGVSLLILYFILPETKDNYFKYGKFVNTVDDDEEANTKMITRENSTII